jgi:hypothetical protein
MLIQHQQSLLGLRNFDDHVSAVATTGPIGGIAGMTAVATVASIGSPRIASRVPTPLAVTSRLSIAAASSIAALAPGGIKKDVAGIANA